MTFKHFKLFILFSSLCLSLSTRAMAIPTEKEIAFEGFNFKLSDTNSKVTINLVGKQGPLKIHAEMIETPTRFFIDVLGVPSRTARSIDLHGDIIERIRVGIHRDKTRIVFDIKTETEGLKFTQEDQSDVNISSYKYLFNLTGQVNNSEKEVVEEPTQLPTKVKETPTQTPTQIPTIVLPKETATPTPTVIPSSALTPLKEEVTKDFATPEVSKEKIDVKLPEVKIEPENPSPIAKIKPEEAPISSAKPLRDIDQAILDMEKNNQFKKAILKNVVFQTTSDNIQSSIAVSLSQIESYTLNPVSDTKYVLDLPATKLRAPHLSLPQYPPDSFKGFVYIKAEETQNTTSVIIVVDPGVKLTAEVSQGKLWIKSK